MSVRFSALALPAVAAQTASTGVMRISRTASAIQKDMDDVKLLPGLQSLASATVTPASMSRRASGYRWRAGDRSVVQPGVLAPDAVMPGPGSCGPGHGHQPGSPPFWRARSAVRCPCESRRTDGSQPRRPRNRSVRSRPTSLRMSRGASFRHDKGGDLPLIPHASGHGRHVRRLPGRRVRNQRPRAG